MNAGIIGTLILWLIVAIVVIAVAVYLLHWLYHRSTKELAFVRTGLGGEKVVINSGALVLPIVHEVTPVNLNVVRIPVSRTQEEALITRDRMRVDVETEFFVRVIQEEQAVSAAASTLGRRTLEAEQLAELLSGKFVGALRSAAAEMSLDAMHENRGEMLEKVQARAKVALAQNGLELESVAITDLDQTHLQFFDPSNRFDAEGMTNLIQEIESRRKLRNDIEQSSMVEIRSRNLKAEQETLKLEQASESSRLDQALALESMRAEQQAAVQRKRAQEEAQAAQSQIESEQSTREREISRQQVVESAEIQAREEVEKIRIENERILEQAKIDRERQVRVHQIKQQHEVEHADITAKEDLERSKIVSERQVREARILAEQEMEAQDIVRNREIEVTKLTADKTVEQARIDQDETISVSRIERDLRVRAQQIAQRRNVEEAEISAREEVERARIASDHELEEERINRDRELKRLEVERSKVLELTEIDRQISILAKQSEEAAARTTAEAAKAQAVEAEQQVITVRETQTAERIAAVDRLMAKKDADTAKIMAEAEKVSSAVAAEAQRLKNEAENILSPDARSSLLRAKLIERIEGIVRESVKPMENIEGIKILHVDGLGNGGGSQRSPTDEVIESALRYRAQAPLIDEMMRDIGVSGSNITGMGDIFRSAREAQALRDAAKKQHRDTGKKEG